MKRYEVEINGVEYDITRIVNEAILAVLKEVEFYPRGENFTGLKITPLDVVFDGESCGIELAKKYWTEGCVCPSIEEITVFYNEESGYYTQPWFSEGSVVIIKKVA